MTPELAQRAKRLHISAQSAVTLLSLPTPPALLDARSINSHSLERIRGSLCQPSASLLCGRYVLIYDSGTTSLNHTFSHAYATVKKYEQLVSEETSFALICGGLSAVRQVAPALIEVDVRAVGKLEERVKGWGWAKEALERVVREEDPPGKVLEWLYVGGVKHGEDWDMLEREGIENVVVVGGELKKRFEQRVCYLHIRARDTAAYDLKNHFRQAVAFLENVEKRGGKVLVHCFAGASRSVAVVVAFLIWRGVNLNDALKRVKKVRRAAEPNEGFLRQLREWEKEVRAGMHINVHDDEEEQMTGEMKHALPLAIPCEGMYRSPRRWRGVKVPYSPITPEDGRGTRCAKALKRMSPPNHLALPRAFGMQCQLFDGWEREGGEDEMFVDLVDE